MIAFYFSTNKDLHHKLPKGGYNLIVLAYVYPSYVTVCFLIVQCHTLKENNKV